MTIGEVLALFAPLAGLVALAFWTGALSQRVRSLEATLASGRADTERLVRVETKVDGQGDSIGKIESSIDGIHRALRDLVTMRSSTLIELSPKI